MKLDELQQLWNSPDNQPTPDQQDAWIARFNDTLRKQRRRNAIWLGWVFFVLTSLTAFFAWLIVATDKVKLETNWFAILLLLVPWALAGFLLRTFARERQNECGEQSIAASLKAALSANQLERRKLKALGLMYVVFVPILCGSVWQIHAAGKVTSRELPSMVAFFGVALTISAAAVLAKYWLRLVPENVRLSAVLSQMGDDANEGA
jgi:MFS family permease